MDITQVKRVYFIGIGGIGMSALARYFMRNQCVVSGYDKTPTELTRALEQEGASIHFTEDVALADKAADLVVYTPAVPATHAELVYFQNNGYTVLKRSKVLGLITEGKFVIAVAGSHGKTTVTGMISWILKHSGYDCTALLGGISTNFDSNFRKGFNDVYVVEADEFDRSFLQLSPNIAVITATDSDHLEVYGTQEAIEATFLEFAQRIKPGGTLISKPKLGVFQQYTGDKKGYDLEDTRADLYATNYVYQSEVCIVTLNTGQEFRLIYPGVHNIENAVAAISVCLQLKIEWALIERAISGFTGIRRRFENVLGVFSPNLYFYDDYAHHPEEIRMFLQSMKIMYPDKHITAVFQPHLFTRTRDLADGFAASLDLADTVILLPIYPAREEPIPGVSSELILNKLTNPNKSLCTKQELLERMKTEALQVLCTIGAGDIDTLVQPIKEILKSRS